MKRLILKFQQFKAFFIAFIISRFAPDYENIKKENENLKQDIYSLIKEENTINGIATKIRWEMRFDMDKVIMFGDATKNQMLLAVYYRKLVMIKWLIVLWLNEVI